MSGKAEHRLVALNHAEVALRRLGRVGDHVGRLPACAFQAEFVEMGELNADPSEIVPYAGEDPFDLGGAFVRISGAQIIAPDADVPATAVRVCA